MMRRTVLVIGITAFAGSALGLLLLDPIIAALYEGRGPGVLVDVFAGRDIHPVTHYQQVAAERFRAPLAVLAAAGVVAALASRMAGSARARLGTADSGPARADRTPSSRLKKMTAGRNGLILTASAVGLSVWFLAALLSSSQAIRLSHPTGFYEHPIQVEVSLRGGAALFYTLDGSRPDPVANPEATHEVTGPIHVRDRSGEPNVFAEIVTTVREYTGFTPPDFLIPKATVLRVRGGGAQEVFATYFVGDQVRPWTLPAMSLISEPAYLFDPVIGIRVPGDLTDAWRRSDRYAEQPRPPQIEANYQMRGREWERPSAEALNNPVVVHFCPSTEDCDFEQSVGIRTHGGWSRSFSPDKSLRLYAREEYGSDRFDHPFFGPNSPAHTRLVLRNSGNDWSNLRFMDAFWQSLMPDHHVDTQAYQPLRLFLNGEYWGIYNLRERQDEHYVENVFGVRRDQIEMFDNSTGATLDAMRANPPPPGAYRASPFAPEAYEEWQDFVRRLEPGAAAAGTIESTVDVLSFSDFVIAHTFAGVSDWVSNNSRWWRTTSPAVPVGEGPLDGRWRFMLADFDSATRAPSPFLDRRGNKDIVGDPADELTATDGLPALFRAITHPEAFRTTFLNRYADLMNSDLHPARTLHELDLLVATLEPEMALSKRRWSTGDMDHWHAQVDGLRAFLEDRPDAVRAELVEFFALDGSATITVEFSSEVSVLRVNTLDLVHPFAVRVDHAPERGMRAWSGDYFVGVPVTLWADVSEGHVLTGWSGLPPDARLDFDGSVTFLPQAGHVIRPLVEPSG